MNSLIYILISIIIIFIIILIVFIINIKKLLNNQKKYKEEYLEERKQQLDAQLQEENLKLANAQRARANFESDFNNWRKHIYTIQAEKEQDNERILAVMKDRQETLRESIEEQLSTQKERIDSLLNAHYTLEQQKFEKDLHYMEQLLRKDTEETFQKWYDENYAHLQELANEIKDYQEKRNIINQEILRQRAIDEQQDFYRICLSPTDIDDIQVLNSIRRNLHKHDGLDKLIYDFYISKPVQEMIKRVLEGRAPSGIYKITRLKTGEIYIGKSTDIKARWQQHAKSAFNCGTIAHSILHTTMEKDGIENFTFELLEELPKDKLTEREKYWINFYDSKKYGLNEREG